MKLSIIIVSWNVRDKLKENLQAIYKSKVNFDFEVFVVDNDSSDDSVKMIKQEFSQVELIENKDNLGFAKANNQAIKIAKGQYILLLNPDMLVNENTLQNMIDWYLQNEKVSVAGCHLLDKDGATLPHVRRFPTLWDQLIIVFKIPHIFPAVLDGYLRKDFDYNADAMVDSVRGGFFMINCKNFRELPLLDERYFLWFEEVDFCKTVKHMGGEVHYTNTATCTDLVGQSFGQVNRLRTQKYFRDSMLKYFKKWHSGTNFFILYLAWLPMIAIAWLSNKLNLKSKAKT
jgi:GT2 family glycosyltransferase